MVFLGPDLTYEAAQGAWDGFQSSYFPILFHVLVIGVGAWAVWKGVGRIERVNKIPGSNTTGDCIDCTGKNLLSKWCQRRYPIFVYPRLAHIDATQDMA